jgi:hypothetical protein
MGSASGAAGAEGAEGAAAAALALALAAARGPALASASAALSTGAGPLRRDLWRKERPLGPLQGSSRSIPLNAANNAPTRCRSPSTNIFQEAMVSLSFAIRLPFAARTGSCSNICASTVKFQILRLVMLQEWHFHVQWVLCLFFCFCSAFPIGSSYEAENGSACSLLLLDRNHAMVWNHGVKAVLENFIIFEEWTLTAGITSYTFDALRSFLLEPYRPWNNQKTRKRFAN